MNTFPRMAHNRGPWGYPNTEPGLRLLRRVHKSGHMERSDDLQKQNNTEEGKIMRKSEIGLWKDECKVRQKFARWNNGQENGSVRNNGGQPQDKGRGTGLRAGPETDEKGNGKGNLGNGRIRRMGLGQQRAVERVAKVPLGGKAALRALA